MFNVTEISVLIIILIALLLSLADIWMNKYTTIANKLVYSLIVVLLPILGIVAYWLSFRKQSRQQ